jgi:uncharacterized membrane protein
MEYRPYSRRRSIALVFGCTILGAFAQILFKLGLNSLGHFSLIGVATNFRILAGLGLYGTSTLLLILALRDGELSLLYPVISLTYAWVTLLSLIWLGETMNPYKAIGILIIVFGVGLMGRGGKR